MEAKIIYGHTNQRYIHFVIEGQSVSKSEFKAHVKYHDLKPLAPEKTALGKIVYFTRK